MKQWLRAYKGDVQPCTKKQGRARTTALLFNSMFTVAGWRVCFSQYADHDVLPGSLGVVNRLVCLETVAQHHPQLAPHYRNDLHLGCYPGAIHLLEHLWRNKI